MSAVTVLTGVTADLCRMTTCYESRKYEHWWPAREVEPLTYGLQNSGAPFRFVSLGSVQTSLAEFKHILLPRVFRCVPFHQRVLLAVLLADELTDESIAQPDH